MFGLMKTPAKEEPHPDTVKFADMFVGCTVGFGFMPQSGVSGRRLPITELNSYLFDNDSFVAHRLENDSVDVNLIVADADEPSGTYLALSQRIDPRLFEPIFPVKPESWFNLKEGDSIEAKPPMLGTANGWITDRYTVVMSDQGRFLEGDYRLRKPADRTRLSRPFQYILLVDEENEYALEAERYQDGTLNVFATIYRPATDIGEIQRPPKATPFVADKADPQVEAGKEAAVELKDETVKTETAEAAKPEMKTEAKAEPEKAVDAAPVKMVAVSSEKDLKAAAAKTQADMQPAAQAEEIKPEIKAETKAEPKPDIKIEAKPEPKSEAKPERKPEAKAESKAEMKLGAVVADLIPVHGKFGRLQASAGQEAPGAAVLACEPRLAVLLIEEAQRNQMPLSEVIRKVIDLPARIEERVLIPFAMEQSEVAELARRYNLAASDTDGVRQQIVEELRRFVGGKK